MRLCDARPAILGDDWVAQSASLAQRPAVGEVAGAAIDGVYSRFEESLVLARAFVTVPFGSLPGPQDHAASCLARSVGQADRLQEHTPVLCLLASRGRLREWNDPRESRRHLAIPLLSESFVGSIPMISRLLKELGLPLTWVQDPGSVMMRSMLGSEVGVFYVADPELATDELGRKIIPAQEFVSNHRVRAVFAVGGMVLGGAALVLVFFSKDLVEPRVARAFMPLVNQIKGLLVSKCSMTRVFPQPGGDPPHDLDEQSGGTDGDPR